MPNHIAHRVKFIGEQLAEASQFVQSQDGNGDICPFDFQKIVPRPKDLDITSNGLVMYLQNPFTIHHPCSTLIDGIRKAKLEWVQNFAQACINLNKHGHASWYLWSLEHWGTKWNAYDQRQIEPGYFYFKTAGSHPRPIFIALSKRFPELTISVEYADEEIGFNLGRLEYRAGICRDAGTPTKLTEAKKFAMDLHSWSESQTDESCEEGEGK